MLRAREVEGWGVNDMEEAPTVGRVHQRQLDGERLRLPQRGRDATLHPQCLARDQHDIGQHRAGQQQREQQTHRHAVRRQHRGEREQDRCHQDEVEAGKEDHRA